MSPKRHVIVIGGGAAGFFAALRCAEQNRSVQVTIIEKAASVLTKVRISGGGRCNLTHSCFDPRELAKNYPRGSRELIGPFHRWQPRNTIDWFESRCVPTKTEADGRMFPTSDSSQSIIDCLLNEAARFRVSIRTQTAMTNIEPSEDGRFSVEIENAEPLSADAVMLACGGLRDTGLRSLLSRLGHTIEPPVPSLFTFHVRHPLITGLAGLAAPNAQLSIPGMKFFQSGPLLITHQGTSGPATLRLSAWAARHFHDVGYKCPVAINWLGGARTDEIREMLQQRKASDPRKQVSNWPEIPIPSRLWERMVEIAGVPADTRWAALGKTAINSLSEILGATPIDVIGKSMNKEEFVTCGGVRLSEVEFKTMESKRIPGLFFGGEILDIDGVTGGFNFQAAWTTGHIAGTAMAKRCANQE